MGKIQKLKEGNQVIYPVTVGDAVVLGKTTLSQEISDIKESVKRVE